MFLLRKKKEKPKKEDIEAVIEYKEVMLKFFDKAGYKDLANDEKRHIEKLKKMI